MTSNYPRMPMIYVAGKFSDESAIKVLDNMRDGIWACRVIMDDMRCLPFNPWLDFLYPLLAPGLSVDTLKACSMEALRRSDAVFALPSWTQSPGARDEIEEATQLKIPVIFKLSDLTKFIEEWHA